MRVGKWCRDMTICPLVRISGNGAASQAGRNGQSSVADGVTQRFTGQERDDTGLDFIQARYYSASFGRFTSPDPGNAGVDLTDPKSWKPMPRE